MMSMITSKSRKKAKEKLNKREPSDFFLLILEMICKRDNNWKTTNKKKLLRRRKKKIMKKKKPQMEFSEFMNFLASGSYITLIFQDHSG